MRTGIALFALVHATIAAEPALRVVQGQHEGADVQVGAEIAEALVLGHLAPDQVVHQYPHFVTQSVRWQAVDSA